MYKLEKLNKNLFKRADFRRDWNHFSGLTKGAVKCYVVDEYLM